MTAITLDRTRSTEYHTYYGEACRLADRFRAVPETTVQDDNDMDVTIQAVPGFDIESCTYRRIVDHLDQPIRMTPSEFWFLVRVVIIRFPDKHQQFRGHLTEDRRKEFDACVDDKPVDNEIEWLGEVGFTNHVTKTGRMNSKIDDRNKDRIPMRV